MSLVGVLLLASCRMPNPAFRRDEVSGGGARQGGRGGGGGAGGMGGGATGGGPGAAGTPDGSSADAEADAGSAFETGPAETGTSDAPSDPARPAPSLRVITSEEDESYGGTQGDPFSQRCQPDQAFVGFDGRTGQAGQALVIAALRPLCATLRLENGEPGARVRADDDPVTLAWQGDGTGSRPPDFTVRCPADEFIVGMVGTSGSVFDRAAFRCAPLTLSAARTGLVTGKITTLPENGGSGGTDPYDHACPAGAAVYGHHGLEGSWIHRFGLICATYGPP